MLSIRLMAIESGSPLPDDSIARWRQDLLSDFPELKEASPHAQLEGCIIWARVNSFETLVGAANNGITHVPTALATSEVCADLAVAAHRQSQQEISTKYAPLAVEWAEGAVRWGPSSATYGALARAHLAAASVEDLTSPDGHAAVDAATAAFEKAASLDPHGITYPLQLFELARQRGDQEAARRWAEELLRRNANMRLDPVRALTPEQVARAQAALRPSP